jgi:mannose/fructose/N-acetylgalactosamine-specific phosphotransferase system component IIC
MMDTTTLLLIAWGTLVGVDLIAGPQVMVARPLVAATVTGLIVGDVTTGAAIGLMLELFAWDVLPFGAARYPDYGVGAVAGVWTAAHAPGVLGIGVAVCVSLLIAHLGEWTVQMVRHLNSADLKRNSDRLDDGEYAAARNLHLRGIAREILRAVALVGIGLALGSGVHRYLPHNVQSAIAATVIASGVAVGVGFASGVRLAGSARPKQLWYVAGVTIGVTWVLIR